MKKATSLFLLLFILFLHKVSGQTYTVVDFGGKILSKGILIHRGDHLQSLQHLSGSKDAFVCFIYPGEGKSLLTFEKGKPTKSNESTTGEDHSELYELTIGDFIKAHLSRKTAAKRGFDYFSFFRDFPIGEQPRLLVIDQDTLPLKTHSGLHIRKGDEFVAIVYTGKDSIKRTLRHEDSTFLFMSRSDFALRANFTGEFIWKLKFVFREDGKIQQADFPNSPYISSILTKKDLLEIIRVFHSKYANSDILREQVFAHLDDFYGKFHQETVQRLINSVLSTQ